MNLFTAFMQLSAPPAAVPPNPSTTNGKAVFKGIGCALCHTPELKTGNSRVAALSNQPVGPFSDLLLHHMGRQCADNVTQGDGGPDMFRTAPLCGVGQRTFFLHDGRTSDLVQAIKAHRSRGSEASAVIENFNALSTRDQQDLLNFLLSL